MRRLSRLARSALKVFPEEGVKDRLGTFTTAAPGPCLEVEGIGVAKTPIVVPIKASSVEGSIIAAKP